MKKFLAILLCLAMVFTLVACGTKTEEPAPAVEEAAAEAEFAVAMVTDYGDITDQSFNQSTYESCRDFCEANGLNFSYFKPNGNTTEDRVAMIEKAVDEGFNIIVTPGYAFAGAVYTAAKEYPEIKFVTLDVAKGDWLEASVAAAGEQYDYNADNWDLAKYMDFSNIYAMIYQEELCGYMAGYAAVKLGYTQLGFLGGMAVPAVVRYGCGFVQGANAAAAEDGTEVSIKYAYGNQFFGDADITAAMDTWYAAGTEVVFACGGGIYTSAAEAAVKVGGKVIGVDVDQAAIIDAAYGAGTTVTSAMKGLYASAYDALDQIVNGGKWDSLKGQIVNLGLVSGTDLDANFVGIPTGEGTQFSDSFTLDDLTTLVGKMYAGEFSVDPSTATAPADFVSGTVTLEDFGNIK